MAPLTAESAPPPIAGALQSSTWTQRIHPFPHLVAENVFRDDIFASLEADFRKRLGIGGHRLQFSRTLPTSPALAHLFTPRTAGALALLLSRDWVDLVAGMCGATVTEHVSGALHHHPAGDGPGFVHSDLVLGWFEHQPRADGVVVADHTACRYGTGQPQREGVAPRALRRSVSILFFLCNPSWSSADEGATGLYRRHDDPVEAPARVVLPENNSLIAFRCTPHSYHAFLGVPRRPRNSVAMWLHEEPALAESRWGAAALRRAHDERFPKVGA